MGRPPKGFTAMSNAQRQSAYRKRTDEKREQTIECAYDRIKELTIENKRLEDENSALRIENLLSRKNDKLSPADRILLVKLLGVLGSEHAGERDNAARHIEKIRTRINKS
jgi:hypothetical protein